MSTKDPTRQETDAPAYYQLESVVWSEQSRCSTTTLEFENDEGIEGVEDLPPDFETINPVVRTSARTIHRLLGGDGPATQERSGRSGYVSPDERERAPDYYSQRAQEARNRVADGRAGGSEW